MLFKGLNPVEKVSPLLVFYGNRGITTPVYDFDSIPVRLSTIRHESLELGLRNTVLCHNDIEVPPKYTLSSNIL
jgi:hypothetical protein